MPRETKKSPVFLPNCADIRTALDTASIPTKTEERQKSPSDEKWIEAPSDKADLNKLARWLYRHDGEWFADALWLRYTKIAKVVYSHYHYRLLSSGKTARRERIPEVEEPPMPYDILPAIPPCDGLDPFSALPHDLRFEILSYLLLPNIRMRLGSPEVIGHALNSMALVSRSWRDQVEAFCDHALLAWRQAVRKSDSSGFFAFHYKPDLWVEWRALKTYTSCARMEYVFRTRTCCAFCGTNEGYLMWSTTLGMMWCSPCRKDELGIMNDDDGYGYDM